MATKTTAPEPTEQPSESAQPLPMLDDGDTYVRHSDGSLIKLNDMPSQGGTYIRNADGSLTKVEDHAQS